MQHFLLIAAVTVTILGGGLAAPFSAYAAADGGDPALVLHSGSQNLSFKRSELLKRADVTAIHVDHDPAYEGKAHDYAHAVPLRPLFSSLTIPEGALLQFECLDGFSAPLSKERLLNDGGSVPYLAIEAPGEKWATVSSVGGAKNPGPYYLIWKDPEKSKIGTEEWPFALAGFTIKDSLQATFPQIIPDASVAAGSPVRAGLKVFVKNCFGCHTLNLAGQSRIGPDLNVPMSPTEYLSEANLKKLIRNPQNLRSWPESKMNGFSAAVVSDGELTELIAYLKSMRKHKVAVTKPQ